MADVRVPVQAHTHGVRHVGTDLDEGRPPLAILNVEINLIDVDRLAREGEAHALFGDVLLAFEAGGFLLGDADEHHAFVSREVRTVLGGDAVFLLAAAEMNNGYVVLVGEGGHFVGEALQQRSEQDW